MGKQKSRYYLFTEDEINRLLEDVFEMGENDLPLKEFDKIIKNKNFIIRHLLKK